MKVKLLHCGDFHLDAPFISLSDAGGKPEQRRRELKQALLKTVELAREEKADMLLICGDLYEHGYIRKSTVNFIFEQFEKISETPVLIIPGNHDPAVAGSVYCNAGWPPNVHILAGGNGFFEHKPSGTVVYGERPDGDRIDQSRINILMHHGTLDMPFNEGAYGPVSSDELDEAGYDYCALGHFHSRIEGAGKKGRIYNAGSPEALGFDEEGDHGVFIASVEKQNEIESTVSSGFIKLGLRHFINLDIRADSCNTDEQAAVRAQEAMEEAGSCGDLYKITLQGRIPCGIRLDTACIADLLRDRAFYLKIIDHTVPDYDFERIAGDPGLRGLFVRKMLERAAGAEDEAARRLVMKALYYGMEAIDEGRVCI